MTSFSRNLATRLFRSDGHEGGVPLALAVVIAAAAALFAWGGLARYATFHNETFDLAFYARMAWGMCRGDGWQPIVSANLLGLHLSPILIPLGLLGVAFGTVPVLIIAQGLALAGAAWPLASLAARRAGSIFAWPVALAWLLHPNLSHVATYEFHPGTLAILPLAVAIDAIDRGAVRRFVVASVLVLACREDLGLVVAVIGWLAMRRAPAFRRSGRAVVIASLAYVAIFVGVLLPFFGPREGSLALHFGEWGSSPWAIAHTLITSPGQLLAHVATRERLTYLPLVLGTLCFLPLLRPRWLLAAAPVFAINLLSGWPTATALHEHYLTAALAPMMAAAVETLSAVHGRLRWALGLLLLVAALLSALIAGQTPLSFGFTAQAFRSEPKSEAASKILREVRPGESVQAPYALLAHLAERDRVHRGPPPDSDADVVILDLSHRETYAHMDTVLRTTEEPTAREWLAKPGFGVAAIEGPYALVRRDADPRQGPLRRYFKPEGRSADEAIALTECLGLVRATRDGAALVLELLARGPCPPDLAVRIGHTHQPQHVDLLFDGLLSPAHLRGGDVLLSRHVLSAPEWENIERQGLRVGLIRATGARPVASDPTSVAVGVSPR